LLSVGGGAIMVEPVAIEKTRDRERAESLIALAQKLARDAERHAMLSDSLASQADRLMVAGLRLLDPARLPVRRPRLNP